jgi:large subunit ribosomal protein L5e
MPFQKVIKNRAYFMRYQTKFRRRREGKTDYRSRIRMIVQDFNKYGAPKYRFVVRFSNRDIITQICYAKLDGDHVMAAAYSHELPRYGIKLGLTNFAAAYATGLLLARRVLKKLRLDTRYAGVTKATGEDYNVVSADRNGPRPFKAFMDIGLGRATTGHRLWAALKGVTDGGVYVPHGERRFVGYDKEKSELKADVLRKYIFGGHVAAYMKKLATEDPATYDRQFSRYKKEGIKAEQLEKIYAGAHQKIRANPDFVKKTHDASRKAKSYRKRRLTLAERKNSVKQKKIRLGYPDINKAASSAAK